MGAKILLLYTALFCLLHAICVADEYYSARNGKYLGYDNSLSTDLRLIDETIFKRLVDKYGTVSIEGKHALIEASKVIKIDQRQIQNDMQQVRDLSMKGK